MIAAFCALFGLAIGSFLNVVIWRVPRGESVVSPPSACPSCGTEIRNRDNVPVVGWLLLRGRCRDCANPISARYPLVELGTAAVFVALAVRIGPNAALPAFLYLGAISVALALIDIDVHRLPDAIVLPSYPGAFLLLGAAAFYDGTPGPLIRAAVGAAALYAFYFVLRVAHPAGMGGGDVKLAGVLGAYLGWLSYRSLVAGAFLGFFVGGVFSVALLLAGRAGRKSKVPFGPFMIVGAGLGIFIGSDLIDGYLSLTVH